MKHTEMQQQLSLFFDDRLSGPDRSDIINHLESCAECRQMLSAFQEVRLGIKTAGSIELSGMFASNVIRTIRQLSERERSWFGVDLVARRLVFALGMLSVVIIGASALNQQDSAPGPDRYFTGEPGDSSIARTLLQADEISKDDVLIAAVVN